MPFHPKHLSCIMVVGCGYFHKTIMDFFFHLFSSWLFYSYHRSQHLITECFAFLRKPKLFTFSLKIPHSFSLVLPSFLLQFSTIITLKRLLGHTDIWLSCSLEGRGGKERKRKRVYTAKRCILYGYCRQTVHVSDRTEQGDARVKQCQFYFEGHFLQDFSFDIFRLQLIIRN